MKTIEAMRWGIIFYEKEENNAMVHSAYSQSRADEWTLWVSWLIKYCTNLFMILFSLEVKIYFTCLLGSLRFSLALVRAARDVVQSFFRVIPLELEMHLKWK